MKNILKLLEQPNTSVYVKLPDSASAQQFLQEAESAGFRFADGAKPTEHEYADIMALNGDRIISYVGTCGHIAFGCPGAAVLGRQIICLQFQNGASCSLPDSTRQKRGKPQKSTHKDVYQIQYRYNEDND